MPEKKHEHNLILEKVTDDKIVIKGNKLGVRWLDSYILIWSGKEHEEE